MDEKEKTEVANDPVPTSKIKTEERRSINYNGIQKREPWHIALVVAGLFIILGGAFALGKLSGRHLGIGRNINYRVENFDGRRMMGGQFRARGMMGSRYGRGFVGEVTKIDGSTITVKINNSDYAVVVSDSTSYAKNGQIAKQSDLKVGDTISISGASNSQGQISARIITIN